MTYFNPFSPPFKCGVFTIQTWHLNSFDKNWQLEYFCLWLFEMGKKKSKRVKGKKNHWTLIKKCLVHKSTDWYLKSNFLSFALIKSASTLNCACVHATMEDVRCSFTMATNGIQERSGSALRVCSHGQERVNVNNSGSSSRADSVAAADVATLAEALWRPAK